MKSTKVQNPRRRGTTYVVWAMCHMRGSTPPSILLCHTADIFRRLSRSPSVSPLCLQCSECRRVLIASSNKYLHHKRQEISSSAAPSNHGRSTVPLYTPEALYLLPSHFSSCPPDIKHLFEVHSELCNVAAEWKGLGLALRLHPGTLDTIEADCRDVQSRLREVLTQWLKKAYDTRRFGAPSWQLLVAAVAHPAGGNNPALAHTIAHNHNGRFSSVQYNCYEIMGGGEVVLVHFDSDIFSDIFVLFFLWESINALCNPVTLSTTDCYGALCSGY